MHNTILTLYMYDDGTHAMIILWGDCLYTSIHDYSLAPTLNKEVSYF